MPRNIDNIYVRIFGKYLHFWRLGYIWIIYPTLYVRFSNILLNNNMIKISAIHVSTTVSLLQTIYICQCMENIQRSLLAYPDFNNISIDNYKQ